jgi:transcriptional accessory protein Tex/SPT6
VHPESYPLVEKMARDLGVCVKELMHNDGLLKKIDPKKYISEGGCWCGHSAGHLRGVVQAGQGSQRGV